MAPKKSELEKKNKIKIIIFTIVSISKRNKNSTQQSAMVVFCSIELTTEKLFKIWISFLVLYFFAKKKWSIT